MCRMLSGTGEFVCGHLDALWMEERCDVANQRGEACDRAITPRLWRRGVFHPNAICRECERDARHERDRVHVRDFEDEEEEERRRRRRRRRRQQREELRKAGWR
ncbi:hypothetical protein CPLU01_05862 [Colletotrichum plurivorum]|uniref:Uncharacterized protein n=1 Tax=Colletotrichum plurivorum TaxID=2175906 RepID=A0A8H6KL21_9PEZI|nr:hypothetical protein CPLU01_05862 [Colletotrichum plurivorum]